MDYSLSKPELYIKSANGLTFATSPNLLVVSSLRHLTYTCTTPQTGMSISAVTGTYNIYIQSADLNVLSTHKLSYDLLTYVYMSSIDGQSRLSAYLCTPASACVRVTGTSLSSSISFSLI